MPKSILNTKIKPISIGISDTNSDSEANSLVWSTKKVDKLMDMIERGQMVKHHPFYDKKTPEWRGPDVVFKMDKEEAMEYIKCSRDVVYFAEKYAYSMTEEGIQLLKLRDYQKEVLHRFQNNDLCVQLSSRQIGKCNFSTSKIDTYNIKFGKYDTIPLYKLYYMASEKTIMDRLKYSLYWLYDKLDS